MRSTRWWALERAVSTLALNTYGLSESNHENALWGSQSVEPRPIYLGGLRLRRCLYILETLRRRIVEIRCGVRFSVITRSRIPLAFSNADPNRHSAWA